MQMRDGFAAVLAVINDKPVAGTLQTAITGKGCRNEQEVAQQLGILGLRKGDALNRPLGDNQQVRRRLRMNVLDRDAALILVDNGGGNLAADDFGKDGVHQEGN